MQEITINEQNKELSIISPEISLAIKEFEQQAKEIEQKEKALKELILNTMLSNAVSKVETNDIICTVVEPSNTETFDTKAFRASHPDLYDEYVKIAERKAYLKITIKK